MKHHYYVPAVPYPLAASSSLHYSLSCLLPFPLSPPLLLLICFPHLTFSSLLPLLSHFDILPPSSLSFPFIFSLIFLLFSFIPISTSPTLSFHLGAILLSSHYHTLFLPLPFCLQLRSPNPLFYDLPCLIFSLLASNFVIFSFLTHFPSLPLTFFLSTISFLIFFPFRASYPPSVPCLASSLFSVPSLPILYSLLLSFSHLLPSFVSLLLWHACEKDSLRKCQSAFISIIFPFRTSSRLHSMQSPPDVGKKRKYYRNDALEAKSYTKFI